MNPHPHPRSRSTGLHVFIIRENATKETGSFLSSAVFLSRCCPSFATAAQKGPRGHVAWIFFSPQLFQALWPGSQSIAGCCRLGHPVTLPVGRTAGRSCFAGVTDRAIRTMWYRSFKGEYDAATYLGDRRRYHRHCDGYLYSARQRCWIVGAANDFNPTAGSANAARCSATER